MEVQEKYRIKGKIYYDSGKYDVIPIRVLTIQEGVEGISHTNNITNSSIFSSY